MRGIRDDNTLEDKHMSNGVAVEGRSRDAGNLLRLARERVKKNLEDLKRYADYDEFFNDEVDYLDFCIPTNLVNYLLEDHDPRTVAHYENKAAFIRRARKSLKNYIIADDIRETVLPRLLDALHMLDFIMEYLYTSKLFDMNNNRGRQLQEIKRNKALYPAISDSLYIGSPDEETYADSFGDIYNGIKDQLENDTYHQQYHLLYDDWTWIMSFSTQ